MIDHTWVKSFPGSIIVCDREGIILELNDIAAQGYAKDGGYQLVGKNLLDCHPEPGRTHVKEMLASGKKNVYTIEKNGVKKFVYQTPWFDGGQYAGFVEVVVEIPHQLEHFIRS